MEQLVKLTIDGVSVEVPAGTTVLEAAKAAQDSIRPIRNCFKFGNPNTVTKTAARLAGNNVGYCRRPFCALSDAAVAKIKETVEADHARGLK